MINILLLCQGYQNLSIAYNLLDKGYKLDIIIPTGHPEYEIMKEPLSKMTNVFVIDTRAQFLNLVDFLIREKSYDYIYPTFPDHHMKLISEINDKFNLPGIKYRSYQYLKEKIDYSQIWKDLGISTPVNYQIVPNKQTLDVVSKDIQFPCIVKPSGGMSGLGIKIISNKSDLVDFFKDVDVRMHDYQEEHGTKFKNFEYYSSDTDYIIQEYIDSPVVSIIGHVYENRAFVDLIYDIESESYPYASETALIYPSRFITSDFLEKVENFLRKFILKVNLDNCPFMLDIIVKNNELYFIDFAARTSAGCHLLKYAGEDQYASKLVDRLIFGKEMNLNLKKYSMKKSLFLKYGSIKDISIEKQYLADYIKLPTNNQVNLPRNDVSISNNGYAYISGDSLTDMHKKYRELVESIRVTYL